MPTPSSSTWNNDDSNLEMRDGNDNEPEMHICLQVLNEIDPSLCDPETEGETSLARNDNEKHNEVSNRS